MDSEDQLQKIEFLDDFEMNKSLKILKDILKENTWIYRIYCHSYNEDELCGSRPEIYTMTGRGNELFSYSSARHLHDFHLFKMIKPSVEAFALAKGWSGKRWWVRFSLRETIEMCYVYYWDGRSVAIIGNDSYESKSAPPPLKRLLEVTTYAEVVKKIKPAPKKKSGTIMTLDKSIADIVESLSASMESNECLLKSIKFVNGKLEDGENQFDFTKEHIDVSFYFLWLVLNAGFPVLYESFLDKTSVTLFMKEENILEAHKVITYNPGFTEESINGEAYCSGQPCPPLRKVPSEALSLFFHSNMEKKSMLKYLEFIRDFIVRCYGS